MPNCDATELAALNEAGPLLRCAAENVKNLDPDISLAISEGRAANEDNQWTPQIAARFWNALSKLYDLIQPVTENRIAQRTSNRFLAVLLILFLIIVPLQLYSWTCTNLSNEMKELISSNQKALQPVTQDYYKLEKAVQDSPNGTKHVWSDQDKADADKLWADTAPIITDLNRINYDAHLLDLISNGFVFASSDQYKPIETPASEKWSDIYWNAFNSFPAVQFRAQQSQGQAVLKIGIIASFILPILFGMIGAVAYVLRAISDQIKDSTFLQNSPTRHLMRVALGALAGMVVGLFNGLPTQLSLSPLAVAFLAGYGVEALFSVFDGLIAKFRNP